MTECRTAFAALGSGADVRAKSEEANAKFRRSLYIVADVKAGEALTEKNVRSIRPGYGLAPKHLKSVLGKRAAKAIARGTPLSWDLIG